MNFFPFDSINSKACLYSQDFQPVLFGSKIVNPETSYSSLCLQISAAEVMESYKNHNVCIALRFIQWSVLFIQQAVCAF